MRQPYRMFVVLAVLCCFLVSSCSSGGPTAFQRTTLPAASDPKAANDPRLTAAKMWVTDPCGVLARLDLKRFGGKGNSSIYPADDPSYCVENLQGESSSGAPNRAEVQMVAEADPTATSLDAEWVRGMPTNEDDEDYECIQTVLTDSAAKRGVRLTLTSESSSNCAKARAMAGMVIDQLRKDAPKREDDDSIAALKPCEVLDDRTVSTVLGVPASGATPEGAPYSCQWQGVDSGLRFALDMKEPEQDPKAKKVDLGNGIQAVQTTGSVGVTGTIGCTLSWVRHTDKRGFHQSVQFSAFEDVQGKGGDLCAKAVQAGKVLVAKLPKA